MERALDPSTTRNALVGLLIGGLAGAVATLVLAPQSGKRTRPRLLQEGTQWRDRTIDFVNNALDQVRSAPHGAAAEAQDQRRQTWRLSHDSLVRQLDRVSATLEARKTAVRGG